MVSSGTSLLLKAGVDVASNLASKPTEWLKLKYPAGRTFRQPCEFLYLNFLYYAGQILPQFKKMRKYYFFIYNNVMARRN